MSNRQELIKWMTEKKESLSFESKVQLIKDFWDNQSAIKDFSEKFGKSNLEEVEQLIHKEREAVKKIIGEKTNQIAQLYELFQGSAKIFRKQHNYIDQIKNELEEEVKAKGVSEEQVKHLQKDIKSLDDQKKELDWRIRELKKAEEKSKELRDKEIADLKKKIQELTEVKMAREKSEDRLREQSVEFLKVQQMNQVVYDILGEHSKETGLLLRSREVVKKLKEAESKIFTREEAELLSNIGYLFFYLKNNHTENIRDFGNRITNLLNNEKHDWRTTTITTTITTTNLPHTIGNASLFFFGIYTIHLCEIVEKLHIELEKTKSNLQKELSWWDKWIADEDNKWDRIDAFCPKLNQYLMNENKNVEETSYALMVFGANLNRTYRIHRYNKGNEDLKKAKNIIKTVYQYYRDK